MSAKAQLSFFYVSCFHVSFLNSFEFFPLKVKTEVELASLEMPLVWVLF